MEVFGLVAWLARDYLLWEVHAHQLLFKAVGLDGYPSAALATPASFQQTMVLLSLPSYAIERTQENRDG